MNNNIYKYIPFLMLVLAFTLNACSQDEDIDRVNSNFDTELEGLLGNLLSIETINLGDNNLKSLSHNHIYLSKDTNVTFDNNNLNNSINNLHDLVELKYNHNLQVTDSLIQHNDLLGTYTLSEQQVLIHLQPTIQEAKNFFYSKGFNDFEIIEMLDGEEEYTLIPIVMEVQRQTNNNSNNANPFMKNVVRDCFLETTGIAAGIALVGALTAATLNKTLVKELIKKALKKIGGRVLGGIGLALLVIDFTWCVSTYEDPAHFAKDPS